MQFWILVDGGKTYLGCSSSTKSEPLGCLPVQDGQSCNLVGGLQLSTSTKAKKCYCKNDGCNKNLEKFKINIGGYLTTIVGLIGMIGNCLSFGVLVSIKKKSNIDIILTSKYLGFHN